MVFRSWRVGTPSFRGSQLLYNIIYPGRFSNGHEREWEHEERREVAENSPKTYRFLFFFASTRGEDELSGRRLDDGTPRGGHSTHLERAVHDHDGTSRFRELPRGTVIPPRARGQEYEYFFLPPPSPSSLPPLLGDAAQAQSLQRIHPPASSPPLPRHQLSDLLDERCGSRRAGYHRHFRSEQHGYRRRQSPYQLRDEGDVGILRLHRRTEGSVPELVQR